MNTAGSSNDAKAAGGYGNVEFNGLPATSNGYILDGYDTQRSVAGTEYRAIDEPGHRPRCGRAGDREHELLLRRSGEIRRVAGELLHQVGNQQVSRRLLRVVEWFAAECGGLLSARERHAGQCCEEAALDGERIWRERGRTDSREQALLLLRTTRGSASRCRWCRRWLCRRRRISNMC